MNGLQSLPQWESAFNYPSSGNLGLLNAIQVSTLRVWSLLVDRQYVEHWCTGRLSICPLLV